MILKADPNATDSLADYGWSPLHWIAEIHPLKDEVKMNQIVDLLKGAGAYVNKRNRFGATPLHYAFNEKTIAVLLQRGADVRALDNRGMTPLHQLAFTSGLPSKMSFQLMLQAGADPDQKINDPSGHVKLYSAIEMIEYRMRNEDGERTTPLTTEEMNALVEVHDLLKSYSKLK